MGPIQSNTGIGSDLEVLSVPDIGLKAMIHVTDGRELVDRNTTVYQKSPGSISC